MKKFSYILILLFIIIPFIGPAQSHKFGMYIIGGIKSEKFRVIVNDSIYIFNFEKKKNWFDGTPNIGYIDVLISKELNDGDKYPILISRKKGNSNKPDAVIDDLYFIGCYPKYLFLLRSPFARKEYGYIARWSNTLLSGFHDENILKDIGKYKADVILPYSETNFFKNW